MKYDVCVIGLGYIGLPTSSIFANRGLKVLGVDVRSDVVDTINQGGLHFHEPDLDILVRAAVQSGNLRAGVSPRPSKTFIIAVPTPFLPGANGLKTPDLSYVENATRAIAPHADSGDLVILESTSPVGTTEKVRDWLLAERAALGLSHGATDFLFAHCPERVLPGQMLKELVANDRIVGGLTPEAAKVAGGLYQTFCTAEIFLTDARTAEMAKLTENAFRDVNIAFANELSLICDRLGIDVWELIKLANRHPRVKILQPGPGVGGHCIAVDPWFIVDSAPDLSPLIRTAREVNDGKPAHVVRQVKECATRFQNPVIACLGLAFKADVDDMRESPAVAIVRQLADEKAGRLLVVEPHAVKLPSALAKRGIELVSLAEGVAAADIVILLVNHRAFAQFDRQKLMGKLVLDTRGIWR